MSFIKKMGLGIAGLLLLLIVIGLVLPGSVVVDRNIEIVARPATVFALINDFRRMNEWSPWIELDPNAQIDYSGPRRGAGAAMTWSGPIIGYGGQEIIASEPHERIEIALDLGAQGEALTSFELWRTATGTRVTWRFENNFGFDLPGRYFGLFLDGIVGADYEKGLANLKELAERLPSADFGNLEIAHLDVVAEDIIFKRTNSLPQAEAVSEAVGEAYFELLAFISRQGLRATGPAMAIGGSFNGNLLEFRAAIPVSGVEGGTAERQAGIEFGQSYAGAVIRVRHVGSYRNLGVTHEKIAAYFAATGIQRNGESWEVYVSDPTRVSEAELVTEIFYPVQEND